MSDTAQIVREILSEELQVALDRVVDSANIVSDLGADDMDSIDIVISLEDKFEIELDESLDNLIKGDGTVGELITVVEEGVSANQLR